MRIALLTDGGHPGAGERELWCDRLVHGLARHEFDIYALSSSTAREDAGRAPLPPQVRKVRTAPLRAAREDRVVHGRRVRRLFAEHYGDLAAALCGPKDFSTVEADRFSTALYGLAELARDHGCLAAALRSETAVRVLERACRAPGARRTVRDARVPDLLAVVAYLERALRPCSLDWYTEDALGAVDLCHATAGGVTCLPGLLAHRFLAIPLLVTEYGVHLRTHYLTRPDSPTAVRALLAAFHRRLAAETYRRATFITPGGAHDRRWQKHCGADPAKLRTVHPGMDAAPFAEVGESPKSADPHTLAWAGRVEPAADLVSLLHAFAEIRTREPKTRLRITGSPAGPEGDAYLGHCRTLAAHLFPDEADGPHAVGANPVSFEERGGPGPHHPAAPYAGAAVTVLSSVVEGFPTGLVEAMFCGRATVSTDVGAVVEVIGGTGLVVPPRNPHALADACVSLLRDPARRARIGAAARARALELFSVDQNLSAFHGLYLETAARTPVRRLLRDNSGAPLPFAAPAEAHVPGHWTEPLPRTVPMWATATETTR